MACELHNIHANIIPSHRGSVVHLLKSPLWTSTEWEEIHLAFPRCMHSFVFLPRPCFFLETIFRL